MDANQVVPDRVDRDHVRVVLEFLGEGIRQPREAPIVHPHRQIRALAVGRAHVRHVGLAVTRSFFAPMHSAGL